MLLNGHPYLFWDTYGYFRQGLAYWRLLVGWLGWLPIPPEARLDEGWLGAAGRLLEADPAIRSIPYSLVLYPVTALGSFWALALATAIVAAYTVDVALERLFALDLRRRLLAHAVLATLTTLPWFAAYLMPDLFAGLFILAAATLAFAWHLLARSQRVALLASALLAASFHVSHLILALALIPLAAACSQRLGPALRLGAVAAGAMLLTLLLSLAFFGSLSLGPRSPPFLFARQIEDGPARLYLRDVCPGGGWALCPVADRMWTNAQDFLWSERDSYFALRELRGPMRREEAALVASAALAYPWLQLRASLRNLLRQLGHFGLDDHVRGRGASVAWDDYEFTYDDRVFARRVGLEPFSWLIYATTVASALALVGCRLARRDGRRLGASGWFLIAGLVLNAAICGVLSGPNARYQGRVVWLLPLLACAIVLRPADRPAAQPASSASAA